MDDQPRDETEPGTSPPGDPARDETQEVRSGPVSEESAMDGDVGRLPIETDASVPTEAVEPPPIELAVAPSVSPRRVSNRLSVVLGLAAVVAIGAVGAMGYSMTQDLGSTRVSLATAETELAGTKMKLETTSGSLAVQTTTLATAKQDHGALDATITELSTQVEDQTNCLSLQTAALAELGRIEQLQTENFNRTTEKSAYAKAEAVRAKAISAALDDYYQAYSKAFQGGTSAARTWAAKGKDAEATITAEEKKLKAELKTVDAKAAEIEAALDALEQQLAVTEAACAEVTP